MTKRKKHCCIVCGQIQSDITRHLKHCHKDTVTSLVTETNSSDEQEVLDKLKKMGDSRHNAGVRACEGTELIVSKSVTKSKVAVQDYIECTDCCGTYHRHYIRKHRKNTCDGSLPENFKAIWEISKYCSHGPGQEDDSSDSSEVTR